MRRHRGSQGTIRSLPVSPCEPVTPMATPQRPLGNRLITGGAGPDLPAAPSHNVEPHPQAGDESAEHQGAGQGASAAQSTTAPRMLVWATSLTTTPGLRRPRRAGRPPEPSTGP